MIAPSWDNRTQEWYWPTPGNHPDYPGKVILTDDCQRLHLIGIPNPMPSTDYAQDVICALTAAIIWKDHHS